MLSFASIPFLLYFLPISVALFYLTRKINKHLSELILIICSVVFYTYESSEYQLLIGILSISERMIYLLSIRLLI